MFKQGSSSVIKANTGALYGLLGYMKVVIIWLAKLNQVMKLQKTAPLCLWKLMF